MTKKPSVSIVMPHLILDEEIFELCKKCISSIKEYSSDYELIFVDNASPLHNDWLKENCDVYIKNEKNTGNGPGWNTGARVAKGDYICFCDNDIYVCENWLEDMKKTFQENTGVVFPNTKNKEEERFMPKLSGFCWMVPKKIWDEIGEIDEQFEIANFEDTDYFERVQNAGYELICNHDILIVHYSRATCDKVQEVQDNFESNYNKYARKHEGKFPYLNT